MLSYLYIKSTVYAVCLMKFGIHQEALIEYFFISDCTFKAQSMSTSVYKLGFTLLSTFCLRHACIRHARVVTRDVNVDINLCLQCLIY